MQWYANQQERRRILPQLNKGEALQDLRAFLGVANKGQLRHPRGEVPAHRASCLNLLTNAVIVWNTIYMAAAVEQLKQEGYPVYETHHVHIWPTRYGPSQCVWKVSLQRGGGSWAEGLTAAPAAGTEGLTQKVSPLLRGSLNA
jgi:hypothetical protein